MKILFTGGGGAGNEALWRLLDARYDLFFGDADIDSINPLIPENRRVSLPWASEADFARKMLVLCEAHGIDVLVPGVDEELPLLAECEKEFFPARLFLPDQEYVKDMLDKFTMAAVLQTRGIAIPFTKKVSDGFETISFPCIIKPRRGRGSRGVVVLNDAREAEHFVQMLGIRAEEYIFQEKLNGVEYTVQMIADRSAFLRAIIPVRVLIKRGVTLSAVVDNNESVVRMCRSLHEAYPAKGCYNIQLVLSDDGLARPFEINPRISTTFCLTIASGIDPFRLFLNAEESEELLLGRDGLALRRFWDNVISG